MYTVSSFAFECVIDVCCCMICHSQMDLGWQNNLVQCCMQTTKLNQSLETTTTNVHYFHFGADREIWLWFHLEPVLFSLRSVLPGRRSVTQVDGSHQRSANTDSHAVITIYNYYLEQSQTWNTTHTPHIHSKNLNIHLCCTLIYDIILCVFVGRPWGDMPIGERFKNTKQVQWCVQPWANALDNMQYRYSTHPRTRNVFVVWLASQR